VTLSGTIERREAAVAAALAGAVVVVLGYASGLGIKTVDAATAAPPLVQPSGPVVPTPSASPTGAAAPMSGMPAPQTIPASAASATSGGTTPHSGTASTPHVPTSPHPSPPGSDHAPSAPAPTCAPGAIEELPIPGSTGDAITSLVSTALGSAPVLGEVAGPPAPGEEPGPLGCVVGLVVGPNCCTTPTPSPEAGR
jgi:hypothetical protein